MDTDVRIIRMREVMNRTGLQRSTIYKRMDIDPSFPKSIPLSDRKSPGAPIGFLLSEVLAWIEGRIAKRSEH